MDTSKSSEKTTNLSSLARFKNLELSEHNNNNGLSTFTNLQDDIIPDYKFERVVGKGSFGVAALYRRIADSALVVLKQINLVELAAPEKELAMNEVAVFSKLHHPNIIRYLGSFIRNDILIIEMEYAECGTLAQKISDCSPNKYFAEEVILQIFEQVTTSVNYMHEENILHRDLKTANVFLNGRGTVKIGDFGISKIMNTKIIAQTVLGTPYYFSPEMCEGKDYDEKSDIWALGCILGEMCCLKKAFSASNLSELVSKIMTAQYIDIPEFYSDDLKQMMRILLQVDPSSRPTAKELLTHWIPQLYDNRIKNPYSFSSNSGTHQSIVGLDEIIYSASATNSTMTECPDIRERSVLYQLKSFGTQTSVIPLQLPSTVKIVLVTTSGAHFIAVTEDGVAYSWGQGNKGQLGHGAIYSWKHYPQKIETLKKHNVIGASTGEGFSIFWTDQGEVLSCGDNALGCLGHGNLSNYLAPKKLQDFQGIYIKKVCCGAQHVFAISRENVIFSWGSNKSGALGLKKSRIIYSSPQLIEIPYEMYDQIKEIYCGVDTSSILLANGLVYVCGKNNNGKLGVPTRYQIVYKFRKMEAIKKQIVDLSISANHSAFIIEGGYVVTMGENSEGQRGIGNCTPTRAPTLVTGIKNRFLTMVETYSSYTVAVSEENIITFWGTRYGIPNGSATNSNSSSGNMPIESNDIVNSTTNFTNFLASITKPEKILEPVDILALYSSNEQLAKGHYVVIDNIYPLHDSVLVLVSTTTNLAVNR